MPQLVDNAVDAVVRSMSTDIRPDEWWDPSYGEDPFLSTWDSDWWLAPTTRTAVGDVERLGRRASNFDASSWTTQYENGYLPMGAMVKVGTELNGATAYLRPDAAASFFAIQAAAARDGIKLTLTDTYRTYDQQVAARARYEAGEGAKAATPGTSNHGWGIAIDFGEGEQREWMAANGARFGWHVLDGEPWHFDFEGDGSETYDTSVEADAMRATDRKARPQVEYADLTLVPSSLGVQPSLADAVFNLYQGIRQEGHPNKKTPTFSGPNAAVKEQLYQGFMDAGRPDLAKMVKTKDFDLWLGAESGWQTDIVSKYYPGHGRNAGLFQFALLDRDWVWDDVDRSSWTYGATAYQQARSLVEYFGHLTPADIRTYADQIRAGIYHGWG